MMIIWTLWIDKRKSEGIVDLLKTSFKVISLFFLNESFMKPFDLQFADKWVIL